ncbi:hypothetical protein D3C83_196570 [compost metagenome]
MPCRSISAVATLRIFSPACWRDLKVEASSIDSWTFTTWIAADSDACPIANSRAQRAVDDPSKATSSFRFCRAAARVAASE